MIRTHALAAFGATYALAATLLSPGAARAAQAQAAQSAPADADDLAIETLLRRLEQAALAGDRNAFLALLVNPDDADATRFLDNEFRSGATRVVVQERERLRLAGTLPGYGYTLTVDAFIEYGDRARVATWAIKVRRGEDGWRIDGQEAISSVENLYRLTLNAAQQYDARSLTILAEDLELILDEGTVFTVDTDQGTTGLVLMGRGRMRFHPAPKSEVEQVRIFSGADILETRFDAAFVRVGALETHVDPRVLQRRPAVDPRDLRRAEQIFREESAKSFVVDLADLTRDTWSLLPGYDDFLAEIRTQRFGTLTYARSSAEAEDISVFERRRHRNIAVYASKDKLATRGRFYNEDDLSPFDVVSYHIDLAVLPDRQWVDGTATMQIRARQSNLGQLTIRLADTLAVRSVASNRFGRMFSLRVAGQNTVLVNLPVPLDEGQRLTVRVDYGGRLPPQPPDRETIGQNEQGFQPPEIEQTFQPRIEPSYLYSSRSYWYPQPTVTDYATATVQITVPADYACVASGELSSDSPQLAEGDGPPRKVYFFSAERPVRYLAFLVTRLNRADRWTVAFTHPRHEGEGGAAPSSPAGIGDAYDKLDLIVDTNPRQMGRGRPLAERAVDVVQYYESLIGDSPYASFTIALVESTLPGGHSPAYFAMLNQPITSAGITWRTDPAAFANYPEFFLAHEVAHQWWGQAVGWRNYHEQWLSEGFAQYFAALYAQKLRGPDVFAGVMRQMSRWAADRSDQGPVYLGYRVGHIKNDGRSFRAIIYNKGAVVLHMLRELVGDETFFRGLRRFYMASRFAKAGTEDFRLAMEAESGRSLERFFERWIYDSTLPTISFSYRVEGTPGSQAAVLHVEQRGELFDFPLPVTLQYADGREGRVLVPVTERVVDFRVPLAGALRAAEVNRDQGLLANVIRN